MIGIIKNYDNPINHTYLYKIFGYMNYGTFKTWIRKKWMWVSAYIVIQIILSKIWWNNPKNIKWKCLGNKQFTE